MTKGKKRGRPPKYRKEFAHQAYKFCLLRGSTNENLAAFFEVEARTINRWLKNHPEFCQSVKEGRQIADSNVAARLYERACGYSHPEDKIFNDGGEPLIVPTIKHYPPDTAAAFIWLKNRAGWSDKQELEHSGGVTVQVVKEFRNEGS